jgi:hemerythrin
MFSFLNYFCRTFVFLMPLYYNFFLCNAVPLKENHITLEENDMAKYQWDESLATGIDNIDDQHKMLIKRLDDVDTAIREGHVINQIVTTLDFLIDYTHYHFTTEENTMRENHYPGLDQHLALHQELKDTLRDLERDFKEEGATFNLANALNTLLYNWLINHIKDIDVQFGKFLKDRGIEIRS